MLAGRPLREWGDSELADYCDRCNVGWVVAWAPASQRRLEAWPAIRPVARFTLAGAEGRLYAVDRRYTWALVGHADMLSADDQRIVLGDLRPWQGRVVLAGPASIHRCQGGAPGPC